MSDVWLRCDCCNKELRVKVDQEMQLAVRFKPSLFPLSLPEVHPDEVRNRCRGCGWVNVFVPAAVVSAAPGELLTPNWRAVSVKA